MRVSKGSLIVMKGKKANTLYIFQGSTVIGATTVSLSENLDLDTTHFLYMLLGHMSERGLHVLIKQGLLCDQKSRKLDFLNILFLASSTEFVGTSIHRTKDILDYIHSDVWGPS